MIRLTLTLFRLLTLTLNPNYNRICTSNLKHSLSNLKRRIMIRLTLTLFRLLTLTLNPNYNRISTSNPQPTTHQINDRRPMIPIVVQYSPITAHLAREWKKIIYGNAMFQNYRLITAYTKHKNLGQLLNTNVRTRQAEQQPRTNWDSGRCDDYPHPHCQACDRVTISNTFTHACHMPSNRP
jgi:hypothetical protein